MEIFEKRSDFSVLHETEFIERIFYKLIIIYLYITTQTDTKLGTVIDRLVAKWLEIKNKEFYYIMTAAENEANTFEYSIGCFRGLLDCLGGSVEKGIIKAGGVYQKGEIDGTPYIQEAFEMGKAV